jgi:CheY-like chemotaxis protein
MSTESPSGKSVLLVEDDAIIRGAMKMVLEWEGYRVTCAANGREALDLLHTSEPPAVIMLDLLMPVLDGWQFRLEQQRDPAIADIPVVVVSAAHGAGPLGASGHVQKPFQPEELLQAIRDAS